MPLQRMAFITRHEPTAEQVILAEKAGYDLIPVGDIDGFDGPALVEMLNTVRPDAVALVHAGAAISVYTCGLPVAVYRNESRAKEGERPTFSATELHVYRPDRRDIFTL